MNTRIKKKMAKRHNIKSFKVYKLLNYTIPMLCKNTTFSYSPFPDVDMMRMYQCFFSKLIPEDSIYISNMDSGKNIVASGGIGYRNLTNLKTITMARTEIFNNILSGYSDDDPDWHFAVINPNLCIKFGFDCNYDIISIFYKENGGR